LSSGAQKPLTILARHEYLPRRAAQSVAEDP
jgi:hypothetical protein